MKGRDIILGILMNKSQTGYEINELLQNQLSHFFDGGYGMIYPTLKKLETEGLVTKTKVTQEDKPNKNIFSITESGQVEFKKALVKPTSEEIFKSDFLMRLYFSDWLDKEKVKEFIKEEIKRKQAKLESLKNNIDTWQSNGMSVTQKITYDYGIAYYQGILDVLHDSLNQF